MKVTRLILAIVLSGIYSYANAQLIPSNLPTTLKNRCSATEDCSISHYSSSPLMQVYQLSGSLENLTTDYYDGLSANNYWLIQYDSKKGSVKNGFSGKAGPNPRFEQEITPIFREFNNEPVLGNVWVLAPTTLDQSWNNFAIFTEDKDISLYMSSEVAISGAGYYVGDLISNLEPQGNMSVDYFRCIPCGFDMDFNLIGLNYLSDFTSKINEDDKRALLLRFRDYLDNYPSEHDIETKIFVQAVPLPSAAWLFASCLFGCFFRFSKKT